MIVTIVSIIKHGAKNTRYLIKVNDKYASLKIPSNKYYYDGMEVDVPAGIKIDYDEKWKLKANSWAYKKRKILIHLGEYKKKELKVDQNGYWENKDGMKLEYDYILPDGKESDNIINSIYKASVMELFTQKKEDIHTGFKNLNSSQAFAFNFFTPIINEKIIDELVDCWKNTSVFESDFEKKNPDETQFDFYLSSGEIKCSFEVKYTEDAFGSASMDEKHNREKHNTKWNTIYEEKLKSILRENIEKEEFFDDYQLWRNIIFVLDGYHVYFVFPKFRDDLKEIVETARKKCKDNYQDKIKILFVDDFVDKMKKSDNKDLRDHYTKFYKKYLDIPKV